MQPLMTRMQFTHHLWLTEKKTSATVLAANSYIIQITEQKFKKIIPLCQLMYNSKLPDSVTF